MEIVIDSNVLEKAGNPSSANDVNFDALQLISYTVKMPYIRIAVDSERLILTEYQRHLGSKFLMAWFGAMQRQKKFTYYSGNLNNKIESDLHRLQFHHKDFKFIAVALQNNTNLIINEADSDWNQQVCEYLFTHGVTVTDSSGCSKLILEQFITQAASAATSSDDILT